MSTKKIAGAPQTRLCRARWGRERGGTDGNCADRKGGQDVIRRITAQSTAHPLRSATPLTGAVKAYKIETRPKWISATDILPRCSVMLRPRRATLTRRDAMGRFFFFDYGACPKNETCAFSEGLTHHCTGAGGVGYEKILDWPPWKEPLPTRAWLTTP